MCGRFTLTIHHLADVAEAVAASLDSDAAARHRPRFNVAPTSRHVLVRVLEARRQLVSADWGLVPSWAAGRPGATRPFNARSETAATKPAFRGAFRSRRCIVPVDGFYEWRGPKGAREPVRFHAPDARVLWLAGLYEPSTDPDTGEVTTSFALLTTEANELVRPVHDRMPVILDAAGIEAWLEDRTSDVRALTSLLRPAPADALTSTPASRRLNTATLDEPSLLDAEPPVATPQLRLFG
jgi:putative SOS response-associated peptidase YedK